MSGPQERLLIGIIAINILWLSFSVTLATFAKRPSTLGAITLTVQIGCILVTLFNLLLQL